MLSIFAFIILGIVAGYLLRNSKFVKHIGILLTIVIMALLFFLGISVGGNKQLVDNFVNIGWDAFLLTVGGTLGSVLCAWWVYRKFFKDKNR